ncbi:FG-GAP-like repeat-containing protein [Novipirellula herctigrandis]|uniref:FG-GAP-like repeat-containing protein n=1 Tax=Novipirellula herctigrandis TaxID=2527986 RepID=UPI003AF3482B
MESAPATQTSKERIEQALQAASDNDWPTANRILRQHLLLEPQDARLHELLAGVAAQQRKTELAIELYQGVLAINDDASIAVRERLAQLMMASGRPFETIAIGQALIDKHPSVIEPRFALTGLASMLGLESIAIEQLKWLAQHNHGDHESLTVLAQPTQVEPDGELCQEVLKRYPSDQRAQYGLAKLDALKMKWREVAERLEPVIELHPRFVPAYVLYGRALIELGKTDSLDDWRRKEPDEARMSSEYWVVAGLWAAGQNDHQSAARAFCEAAVREDANHSETLTYLIASLRQIGHDAEAELVSAHNAKLAALHDATKTLYERETRSQKVAMQVADIMGQLGRSWEAEAWARFSLTLPDEHVSNAQKRYLAIRDQLSPDTPWNASPIIPELQRQIAELPAVAWTKKSTSSGPRITRSNAKLRFSDSAQQLGLKHTTSLAPETTKQGHWIFQSNGGGAAVIDFDLDGWPDLAMADLNGHPMKDDSDTDRLFRNIAGSFLDVTRLTSINDNGFTQGITAGDYNDDGFPDLMIGNIGRNRMFRNNGDGTFEDVTEQVGLIGERWTTSLVIADFNADGHADLFETNYCGGKRPFEKECRSRSTGQLVACTPMDFEAEPDRVWAGRGDGRFADVTDDWMTLSSPGRGLGLVVGKLDESPGLDVYVANDMSANHLWSPTGAGKQTSDELMRLNETATARGVAVSGQSLSQASMGIAVGDPDSDGDLDLFVTHFAEDHNTYYEQVSRGLWVDHSYRVGLSEPSIMMLAFGTQWADFDNDGVAELIVANGHVSDLDREDVAYRMPPQLFQQTSESKWEEMPAKELGDYFTSNHLGRALLTLDANRDGLNDVAITHLYEPVSLLINQSTSGSKMQPVGRSVGLVLVASKSQRDAIGAEVRATAGNRTSYAQLTAGDGYLSSNQRRIPIGMGTEPELQSVTIDWPSGGQQTFKSLLAGHDYLIAEGDAEPFELFQHLAGESVK